MNRRWTVSTGSLVLFCIHLLWIGIAFGQDPFDVLQVSPNAEVQGMGSASIFTEKGITATWGNVGGLGFLRGLQGVFSRHDIMDFGWHHTYASLAKSFHIANRPSAIGVSYTRRDYDDGIETDPPNSSYEEVFGFAGGLRVSEQVSLGVGVKLVSVELLDDTAFGINIDGTALSLDLGALWIPISTQRGPGKLGKEISVGLSIRNLGPDFSYVDELEPFPLPTTIGMGIESAWMFGDAADFYGLKGNLKNWVQAESLFGFRLVGAVEKGVNALGGEARFFETLYAKSFLETNKTVWRLGAEVTALALVSGRIGYVHDEESGVKEATWGIGISALGVVGLDYAHAPKVMDRFLSELENEDRFSIWVRMP